MHLHGRPNLSAAFTLCIHLYAVAFQRLSCSGHIVSFKVFSCRGVTSNRSRRPTHAWKVKCRNGRCGCGDQAAWNWACGANTCSMKEYHASFQFPEVHLHGRPNLLAAFALCIYLYAVAFRRLGCSGHIVSFKVFSCRGVTSNRSRRPTHVWKVKCQKPLLVSIGLALQNPCVRVSDIEGYSW